MPGRMGVEMVAGAQLDKGWTLLVPLKAAGTAKSRLDVGSHTLRARLAMAMACDVVEVVLGCPRVRSVVVVSETADGLEPLSRLGAELFVGGAGTGLNPALRLASSQLSTSHPGAPIAALVGDVAAATVGELTRTLDAAAGHPRAFLADRAETGTTLVAASGAAGFRPEYGPGSRRRHAGAGFVELDLPEVEGLRLDVDTAQDLAAAAALGLGPRTAAVLLLLPASVLRPLQ